MNLVTYNLRSGGKGRVHWAKILEDFRPGLFFVQETVAPEEHLTPHTHSEAAGRFAWRKVEERRWGSAIYSSVGETRPIELPDFRGHVVGMEIVGAEWPDGSHSPIRAFSAHAPARGSYQKAVNQILNMIASNSGGDDLMIGGDFNLTVSARNEGEDRKTSAADMAIQARLKDEFGLVNCWREANPGLPLSQTLRWSNAPETPYHCDGLFVPRSWLGCTIAMPSAPKSSKCRETIPPGTNDNGGGEASPFESIVIPPLTNDLENRSWTSHNKGSCLPKTSRTLTPGRSLSVDPNLAVSAVAATAVAREAHKLISRLCYPGVGELGLLAKDVVTG